MSILSKADFKTKQAWLKQQRKELMKRQSQKYHDYSKKKQDGKQALENTLAHLLTSQTDTLYEQDQFSANLGHPFRNDSDAKLYRVMLQRLLREEEELSHQRQAIKNLQRQIQEVKTQKTLMKGVKQAFNETLSQKQRIYKENAKLQILYADMQRYLSENGVKWSEDKLVGELSIDRIRNSIKAAKSNYMTISQAQFQTISRRISQLNEILVRQFGERKYVNIQGVYRLSNLQEISLRFYKNGVKIDSHFYQYDSKQGLRTIDDLAQGYYPYTLKSQYPQGVIMNAISSLNEIYQQNEMVKNIDSPEKWFQGIGHSLLDKN